jgi:TPR repeat protein
MDVLRLIALALSMLACAHAQAQTTAPRTPSKTQAPKEQNAPHNQACKEGLEAYIRGDWFRAKEILEPAATVGDAACATLLGEMYQKGLKTEMHVFPQDSHQAANWFRIAAEHGGPIAQVALGHMYEEGDGVIQDGEQAVYWFRKAADRGFYQAQIALGIIYGAGRAIAQDWSESARWFRLAAEQNSATAQANLGLLYLLGKGVPKDDVQAYMWFNLAIANYYAFDDEGKKFLEQLKETRAKIGSHLSPEEMTLAQKLSRDWKPKEGK